MTTFQNNKKDWFSHNRLVFMHGEVLKDPSRNSAILRWNNNCYNSRKLQRALSDRLTINTQYLPVAGINQPSLQAKLKLDYNDESCLEGGPRYTFLFCRHVFIFCRKCQLVSISLTCYFNPKCII